MIRKTMRGKTIDFAKLMAKHPNKVAVGNASMNTRGDMVDSHGMVVKPREELAREYHRHNPKAVRQQSIRDISQEVFLTPDEAWKQVSQTKKPRRKIADTD